MPYDLPAVLRAEGLSVVEENDWSRRGGDGLDQQGVMVHHTATTKQWSLAKMRRLLVTHGRPDVPAPLCNLWLRRNGSVHVVSSRKANHAGRGSRAVLDAMRAGKPLPAPTKDDEHGNRFFWGIEAENDGAGEGWPVAQREALERICAAICRAEGWGAHRVIAHREWSKRKPDPRGVNMNDLRLRVAHLLAGPGHAQPVSTTNSTGWEMVAVAGLPTLAKGAGQGAPNPYVKRLQGLLQAEGSRVQMTGVFDASTANAVVASQRRHKITVDGIVGRGTWAALLGVTT